jgi:hypothetical protein
LITFYWQHKFDRCENNHHATAPLAKRCDILP